MIKTNLKVSVALAALLVIYSYFNLYFPQIFVANEDLNLITAFEVDPGSIMQSISSLYSQPYYNMMNGYHSKYYGWTFYCISFIFTLPYVLYSKFFGHYSLELFHITVRFIHLILGFLFIISLNLFSYDKRNLAKLLIALSVSLYLIFSRYSYVFYFLHPETTGAIFLVLSYVFCYFQCNSFKRSDVIVVYTLIFAAGFSKQVFAIACFPLLIYILLLRHKDLQLIRNKYRALFFEILIPFVIVFVIVNPYAIINIQDFIKNQYELSQSFSVNANLTFFQSFDRWLRIVNEDRFISFVLAISVFQPFVLLFKELRSRIQVLTHAVLPFSICLLFMLIVNSNRTLITHHYLFPLFVLCVINFLLISNCILNSKIVFFRYAYLAIVIYSVALFCLGNYKSSIQKLNERLDYKNSIAYKTYDYISKNIKPVDKIAHDHFVAVPTSNALNSCHYWAACGTDYIYEFSPDYIIYNPTYDIGMSTASRDKITKYIEDKGFVKFDTISSVQNNIIDNEVLNGNAIYVNVYRKKN